MCYIVIQLLYTHDQKSPFPLSPYNWLTLPIFTLPPPDLGSDFGSTVPSYEPQSKSLFSIGKIRFMCVKNQMR